jgi:L-ascorbate metabolism protein UlaG (beta-lactamase superfamily)
MTVGAARIRPIVTPHAGVGHNSYLVEWAGRRLYFVGDTEDLSALLAQKNLDVAFVTPWLWRMTKSRNATIDARQVVIYHHRDGENVAGCTGTCRIPSQGDRWKN